MTEDVVRGMVHGALEKSLHAQIPPPGASPQGSPFLQLPAPSLSLQVQPPFLSLSCGRAPTRRSGSFPTLCVWIKAYGYLREGCSRQAGAVCAKVLGQEYA